MTRVLLIFVLACGAQNTEEDTLPPDDVAAEDVAAEDVAAEDVAAEDVAAEDVQGDSQQQDAADAPLLADVIAVEVQGQNLAVTIRSPDTGCDQYANWWEVVGEDGELIHRRILGHSHVSEQPFTRSGGPVEADEGAVLVVRAHMHPGGYGGAAFRGTLSAGFEATTLDDGFGAGLAEEAPLPDGCAF